MPETAPKNVTEPTFKPDERVLRKSDKQTYTIESGDDSAGYKLKSESGETHADASDLEHATIANEVESGFSRAVLETLWNTSHVMLANKFIWRRKAMGSGTMAAG